MFFLPQTVVSAALAGRILIIEGLEKAERNVLPVINNLLENREMVKLNKFEIINFLSQIHLAYSFFRDLRRLKTGGS